MVESFKAHGWDAFNAEEVEQVEDVPRLPLDDPRFRTWTGGGVVVECAVAMTCNWCGTKVVVPWHNIELAGCLHCYNAWGWEDEEVNALGKAAG